MSRPTPAARSSRSHSRVGVVVAAALAFAGTGAHAAPQSEGKTFPARPRLASLSVPELRELAVLVQRAVEARLLEPDERFTREEAELLSLPDTGIARLLSGGSWEESYEHAITVRGGGTYYSFATRDHSYDAEPDLSYVDGAFRAGFYGGQSGLIVDLGRRSLSSLPTDAAAPPPDLDGELLAAWELLWHAVDAEDQEALQQHERAARELNRPHDPQRPGTCYLLRMISPREHDHLVAFTPLEFDATGCTLAFRILKTWSSSESSGGGVAPQSEDQGVDIPRWLRRLELPALLELLAEIRAKAHPKLFGIPEESRARFLEVMDAPRETFAVEKGFARILHRGEWDPLVRMNGRGCYYSFLTQENVYGRGAELQLQQGEYSSGFAGGDRGLLLDVGPVPFEELPAAFRGTPPSTLTEGQRAAWDFLRTVRAKFDERDRRVLSREDSARASELGLASEVPARVGHTYLLRSVVFGDHDHLVLFTVIGGDEYGQTLAWRVLRSWPVEQRANVR